MAKTMTMKARSKRKMKTKSKPTSHRSSLSSSMLPLRGKMKIAVKNRAISERDLEELGHQQLQAFLTVNSRVDDDDDDNVEIEEVEVSRIGDRIPGEERSELEFEVMAVSKSSRLCASLKKENVPVRRLIVNQVLPPSASDCKFCAMKRKDQMRALDMIQSDAELMGLRSIHAPLCNCAIVQLAFYRCNLFFVTRRMNVESFSEQGIPWPPSVFMEINKDMEASRSHNVVMFSHRPGYFQAMSMRRRTIDGYKSEEVRTVCFEEQSCTCHLWQLYHRLCSHALACCASRNLDFSQLIC